MDENEKASVVNTDIIADKFAFEGREIVVIKNEFLDHEDGLSLGELVPSEEGYLLKALSDEDYERAANTYFDLIELFAKEED